MTLDECRASIGIQVTYNGPARPGSTAVTIIAVHTFPMVNVQVRELTGAVFKATPEQLSV